MSSINLTKMQLNNNISQIGSYAFNGCTNLQEINIPLNIQYIGNSVFYENEKITSIELPINNTVELNNNCFSNMKGLETITLSNNSTLGQLIFNNCLKLKKIIFGTNTKFKDSSYYLSSKHLPIETMECPEENPHLKVLNNALYSKDGKTLLQYPNGRKDITTFQMPDTVEIIGRNCFFGNKQLPSIIWSQNLKTIQQYAFSETNRNAVEFPDSLEKIEGYAFYNAKIYTITFGSNPVNITGNSTFYTTNYYMTREIRLKGGVEMWLNSNINDYSVYGNTDYGCKLYLLNSNNEWEQLTEVVIPDNVTSVRNYAFYNFNLKKITLHNKITYLGNQCFRNSDITEFFIPNSVTSLGSDTFRGCDKLTTITFEEGSTITSLPDSMCNGCTNLIAFTIPNTVTRINSSVFAGCRSLTRIDIPDSVTYIDNSCFSGAGVKKIVIGTGIQTIKSTIFGYITITDTEFVCKAIVPPTINSSTFPSSFTAANNNKIIVPTESEANYEAATNWSTFADIIEGGAESYV